MKNNCSIIFKGDNRHVSCLTFSKNLNVGVFQILLRWDFWKLQMILSFKLCCLKIRSCKEDDNVRRRSKCPWVTDPICYWCCGCFRRGSVTSGMAGVCLTSLTVLAASWPDMWRNSALIPQFPPIVSPRRLTFTWWGCCGLCFWHKSTELAHSFLFCSCVSFCLYGLFNCFSVQEFSL